MKSVYSQNNAKAHAQNVTYRAVDLPTTFSWLEQKPECIKVRDQGSCGSCWAMSAVGSFSDKLHTRQDATQVTYSEQYEISVTTSIEVVKEVTFISTSLSRRRTAFQLIACFIQTVTMVETRLPNQVRRWLCNPSPFQD
ncbi:Cathepsin_B [Hexamita inflata]|uniref:Cathepsin B n=1 Tax=Hexamita inflata TaxID=28002 RepID=A0AA86QZF5_9EUKA|nr:Cathepsin B [Hexamita inflata]